MVETQTSEIRTDKAWEYALDKWNSPSIPGVIIPKDADEGRSLGEAGQALREELAFMKYPEYQTYANLEKILAQFKEDPQRGLRAVLTHEAGHRFCPYDIVTSIILVHAVKKELERKKQPYNPESASRIILNLFTDECINTTLARRGERDIGWAYQQISKERKDSRLWKVYAKSMELAWNTKILPKDIKLSKEEEEAAGEVANLFREDFFDKSKWKDKIRTYAGIISKFLEDENKDKESLLDRTSDNIPQKIDEKTIAELAKRLSEIGSNGLPTNPKGLKEFKEILAGFGQGSPIQASITFYDMLSNSYDVMFASRPFGRPRVNPFQPVKWTPSMGADKLDVDYSAQVGGRIIPGVNSYTWKTRRRDTKGGEEEVVPNLDIFLDSSGSMPNPVEQISLPVLAGFVASKKAFRKGSKVRATNFSGEDQHESAESGADLKDVFRVLVKYFKGDTVFPTGEMLRASDPKQVLVITDTFLGNEDETASAVEELKRRNKGNRVAIYALNPVDNAGSLRRAGAEVIHGTTTDIFKRVIGKADEVYTR